MMGVDVFVHAADIDPDALAIRLSSLSTTAFKLQVITNRGVKVWPNGFPETFCTDHWRCRFLGHSESGAISHRDIIALLQSITTGGIDVIKTENLCVFDGERGFALAQGQ
jgi:isocitrate dehydrogenase